MLDELDLEVQRDSVSTEYKGEFDEVKELDFSLHRSPQLMMKALEEMPSSPLYSTTE